MPKISVVMPAYNAEKYIAESINSILGQTYGDFEFVIINDCSQDRTEEIVLSYDDPRIIYLKNEKNLGVAATLNKGLAIAKGEYIARMDADDISMPERFEKQVVYLDKNEDIVVLGCSIEQFSGEKNLGVRRFASDAGAMALDMLFACGLAHPSVMMRTDVIRDLGGYDEEFNGLEDYDLWRRVLEKHNITTLPDILLRYRIHGSQVTQNPSARHLEQMRMLKTRQIQQLGLVSEQAEAFFRFCEEGRPDSAEKIKALDDFFALMDEANTEKQIYDDKKLRATFKAVILAAVARRPKSEQKELATKCHYINQRDLFVWQLKQSIKTYRAGIERDSVTQ